jgi:DNA-binding MarR family transcriptional regulator
MTGGKMKTSNYNDDLTFDEKVLMAIVRAAENFKRSQSIAFKKYGLSFPKYNILRVLEASEMGQNKISAVGKIMLTPGANMTGLAKRLEQAGFIERRSDPDDERVKILAITLKGRETLKEIEKQKDATIDRIMKGISTESKERYFQLTKQIIKATTSLQKELSG